MEAETVVNEATRFSLTRTANCHTMWIRVKRFSQEESAVSEATNDARLNFRINGELKKTIEDAAAKMGQSVSDFAISTLIQASRKILMDEQVTRLTDRDRQIFAKMLDDESTAPNAALVKAAKQYKKQVG